MAKMVTVCCGNKKCGKEFEARAADVARGWGKFCSKSCKAVVQEKRTGQYTDLLQGGSGKPKGGKKKKRYPRHDGRSPMKFRFCCEEGCNANAVNGYYTASGIEWLCEYHFDRYDNSHPFSSDALGQWD